MAPVAWNMSLANSPIYEDLNWKLQPKLDILIKGYIFDPSSFFFFCWNCFGPISIVQILILPTFLHWTLAKVDWRGCVIDQIDPNTQGPDQSYDPVVRKFLWSMKLIQICKGLINQMIQWFESSSDQSNWAKYARAWSIPLSIGSRSYAPTPHIKMWAIH